MRTHGDCPRCGKQRYKTRRQARHVRRTRYPGERLSAYRCMGWWHLGRLPPEVVAGDLSRGELTASQERDPLDHALPAVRQLLVAHLDDVHAGGVALVRSGRLRVRDAVRLVIDDLGDHSVNACPACLAAGWRDRNDRIGAEEEIA